MTTFVDLNGEIIGQFRTKLISHVEWEEHETSVTLPTEPKGLERLELDTRREFGVDLALIQCGYYIETYGDSAKKLSECLGYKTFNRKTGTLTAGFPKNSV
jgi:hypothetical protein